MGGGRSSLTPGPAGVYAAGSCAAARTEPPVAGQRVVGSVTPAGWGRGRAWSGCRTASSGRGSAPASTPAHCRCPGPDERSDRSAAPGRCDRPRCRFSSGSAVTAEERAPQPAQRREQRHPGAAAVPRTEMITCGELPHQGRRPFRLTLRDGGTTQHREMAVETRTGRTAPAADGRDSRPATHCYLFHDSPHPTRAPGPGQGNPISLGGHACRPVNGFTCPALTLTNTIRNVTYTAWARAS